MGAMASAPLTPRLTTDSVMDLTATASALLRLRPSPRLLPTTEDSAMAHTVMASAPLMPMPTTEDSDTDPMDMESAPLTLRPSLRLLPTTDMAATALTAMASAPLMTTDTADTAPTD